MFEGILIIPDHIQNKIYSKQIGSGQPHIYPKDIAKIKIPVPSIEKQQEFIKSYEKKLEEVENNKKLAEQLAQQSEQCKRLAIDSVE